MDNTESKTKSKNKRDIRSTATYTIVIVALFTALTAVFAQISIPIGPVPINLSLLAVMLAGGILGLKKGTISQLVYLLIGTIGVPVFSNFGSGVGKLAGPTGGYIIGYVVAAAIIGLMFILLKKPYAKGNSAVKSAICVLAFVLGLAACYGFGTAWYVVSTGTPFAAALMVCVVPFLIGDAAKIIIATILTVRLKDIVNKG